MDINRMMNHLKQLESIAAKYNNSRSVLNGFNASLDYVIQQIKTETTWQPVVQPFPLVCFQATNLLLLLLSLLLLLLLLWAALLLFQIVGNCICYCCFLQIVYVNVESYMVEVNPGNV